ncbi:hypothetical protein ABZ153_01800 [Streptomyces sp. NPDC006290]|uniref:hypothetical protein n=1 Tax=Streptomyces sp. NPDC006290 TaxID=3156745 RepID=UPI0033AB14E2
MVNFSKAAGRMDVLRDLMGLTVGALLVAVGVKMHHDGGSIGWPIAGTAVLSLNGIWAIRRRQAQRGRDISG